MTLRLILLNFKLGYSMIQLSPQRWSALAATLMFLGVAMGAFGAHALKNYFAQYPDLKEIYHTAVQYQMIHSLGLLYCAQISMNSLYWRQWVCRAFALGILLFSGSLYLLVFTQVRLWGAVTPLGGISFLLGWALLCWSFLQHPQLLYLQFQKHLKPVNSNRYSPHNLFFAHLKTTQNFQQTIQ